MAPGVKWNKQKETNKPEDPDSFNILECHKCRGLIDGKATFNTAGCSKVLRWKHWERWETRERLLHCSCKTDPCRAPDVPSAHDVVRLVSGYMQTFFWFLSPFAVSFVSFRSFVCWFDQRCCIYITITRSRSDISSDLIAAS